MGANDGASGVAVLLELARTLEREALHNQVWLAFFDAEDNGHLDGWDWCIGSKYMAEHLEIASASGSTAPEVDAVVVVDMVGDASQQLYLERNSDATLQARLWEIAATLGYTDTFISEYRWAMMDDHVPFAQRGIPAVDIIDFDYPYWHTTQDTPDKVSAESLERVGRVLEGVAGGQTGHRREAGRSVRRWTARIPPRGCPPDKKQHQGVRGHAHCRTVEQPADLRFRDDRPAGASVAGRRGGRDLPRHRQPRPAPAGRR